jgi:pSer/pThr/pTyr-binding forkhead associated (FHA) protein
VPIAIPRYFWSYAAPLRVVATWSRHELLVIDQGQARSTHPPPGAQLVIGRSKAADVRIDDPYVSAMHVVLSSAPHGVFIDDLGSHNGTWVGALRLRPGRPLRLASGVPVRVGTCLLVVRSVACAGAGSGTRLAG